MHERLVRRAGFVRKTEAATYVFLPFEARMLHKMAGLLEAEGWLLLAVVEGGEDMLLPCPSCGDAAALE